MSLGYLGICFLRQQARPSGCRPPAPRNSYISPLRLSRAHCLTQRPRFPASYIYSVTASTAQTGGCLDLPRITSSLLPPLLCSLLLLPDSSLVSFVIGEGIPWVIHFFVHHFSYTLFFLFHFFLGGIKGRGHWPFFFEAINLMEYSLFLSSFLSSSFCFLYI